ncbi:MAG: cysteine dioxygenase [Parvibaculaceae bacterium]|nr:cysteine dioxygenase [Parvibaculaceae bacterium]
MGGLGRLREAVGRFSRLVRLTSNEQVLLQDGAEILRDLISTDDWLPDAFAAPGPERYQQYLLHCDSEELFSIVSFVWGPGQSTPVHDHTVWGLVGVLRGAEKAQRFAWQPNGELASTGEPELLTSGDVDAVSPAVGDIHRVSNAFPDRTSISIHVYGANIGAVHRSTYGADGARKAFISGYANEVLPNLWDKSTLS